MTCWTSLKASRPHKPAPCGPVATKYPGPGHLCVEGPGIWGGAIFSAQYPGSQQPPAPCLLAWAKAASTITAPGLSSSDPW